MDLLSSTCGPGTRGRRATSDLCAAFWARAHAEGLLSAAADPAALAITTDVLICADTVVHVRRTHRWTVAEHGQWLRAAVHQLVPRRRPA